MKNTRARVEYRGPNAHAGTNFLASAWCLQMHMGQTFNYSAELEFYIVLAAAEGF